MNDIVGDIGSGKCVRIKGRKEGGSGVMRIVRERFLVEYMVGIIG